MRDSLLESAQGAQTERKLRTRKHRLVGELLSHQGILGTLHVPRVKLDCDAVVAEQRVYPAEVVAHAEAEADVPAPLGGHERRLRGVERASPCPTQEEELALRVPNLAAPPL